MKKKYIKNSNPNPVLCRILGNTGDVKYLSQGTM
jgi:hypothetical protein